MKQCPICKGNGYIMIDEAPEECPTCDGTGEVPDNQNGKDEPPEDSLFEQMANLVRPFNKFIEQNYSPYKF
jgi:RecJ-like exonuclease